MRKSLALIVLACAVVGCATGGTTFIPLYSLEEVQRPASARERYGEQVVARLAEDTGAVARHTFEDGMVRIVALVTDKSVVFELANKTEHSVRIIWDEATMVLPEGSPSPVMHSGMRYIDCRSPKPPSVVPAGVKLEEAAYPCSRLHFGSSWTQSPLLAGADDSYLTLPDSTVARVLATTKGRKLALLLPLQIEGVTNEYKLTFALDTLIVRRPLLDAKPQSKP